jgi:hypothetical protein
MFHALSSDFLVSAAGINQLGKIPEGYFKASDLGSYAGATFAVWLCYNVYRQVAKKESPIIALVIAIIIVSVGTYFVSPNPPKTDFLSIFTTFLNACLVFSAASGTQEVVGSAVQPLRGPRLNAETPPRPFGSWFRNS